MRESTLEKYLVKRVKETGGLTYKFVSPNNRGVPDRIVIFPGNKVFFVELKSEDGKLSDAQKKEHNRLSEKGCLVFVIRSKENIDIFVDWPEA